MLNVKQNFKYICTALILLQIITVITIMFIYTKNGNNIEKGITTYLEQTAFSYKNLLEEYLQKKFHMLLEDMLLILTMYSPTNTNSQINIEKCSSPLTKEEFIQSNANANDDVFNTFYSNIETYENSVLLADDGIVTFIQQLMEKYVSWKEQLYINVEYMFELTKVSDNSKLQVITFPCVKADNDNYYEELFNMLEEGNEDNDIAIVTIPSRHEEYYFNMCIKAVESSYLCYAFNYYDLYIAQSNFKNILEKQEIMFYIMDNSLNVVYTPQYIINEIKCNNDIDIYCTNTNLMYYLYNDIINKVLNNNKTQTKDKYTDIINELKQSYEDTIVSNINAIMNRQIYSPSSSYINEYSFNTKHKVRYDTKTKRIEITNTNSIEEIYILYPVIKSFKLIKHSGDNDGSYYELVNDDNKYIYYILIRYQTSLSSNLKKSFSTAIISEFILFLIFIICIDILIWILFTLLHRYIIKGMTLPLKRIRTLYLNILNYILTNIDNSNNESEHSLNMNMNINLLSYNKQNDNNTSSSSSSSTTLTYANPLSNKCCNFLLNLRNNFYKSMSYISHLEKYPEINKALTTLKAICIILQFKTNSPFEYKDINKAITYTNMSNIIEALEFLCEMFYNKYTDVRKENLDYPLIQLITKNLFISMIQMVKRKRTLNVKETDIDAFYLKLKEAIKNAKLDVSRLNKGVCVMQDKAKDDLVYLNIMEEEFIYLYTLYKSNIFVSLLNKHLCEEECDSTIDEEEFTQLKELQNKELHQHIKQNYGLSTNEQYRRLTVKKQSRNLQHKIHTIMKHKQHNNDISAIKEDDTGELSEDTKQYIASLIDNLEQYLKLKHKNTFDNSNNNNDDNSDSNDKQYLNDNNNNNKQRIEFLIELFKDIYVYLLLSQFYILCENGEKCIQNYENALSKLKQFDNKIFAYKQYQQRSKTDSSSHRQSVKIEERKYKRTNFVILIINTIVYENILYIFSMLSERFYQTKNELFLNINILDVSPVYSITKRKLTLIKILKQLIVFQKQLVMNANINLYEQLLVDNKYIEIQSAIYKVQCIMNSVVNNGRVRKKVLFIFDLNNAFVRDNEFKNMLMRYFHIDYNKINNNGNNSGNSSSNMYHKLFSFDFTVFDNKLHVSSLPNYESEVYQDKEFNKHYIIPFTTNDKQNTQDNTINDNHLFKKQLLKINTVFDFIQQFQPSSSSSPPSATSSTSSKHKHRADKALYHSLIVGLNEYEHRKKTQLKRNKVKTANYIIMMTTLSSLFSDNKTNWKIMSELIYEQQYTVIIILSHSPETNQEIINTINNYKTFIKKYLLDGHLFIIRSLSFIKFILNAIFPLNFNEFNSDVIKHYIHSLQTLQTLHVDQPK